MPTNRFYPKVSNADLETFVPKLPRFLLNDLGGYTGPGWTVIDTYCATASSPHEIPGTSTDMDSITGTTNGWKTGLAADFSVGDYCIVQSASTTNKFQVGIEYQATDTLRFIVAPKAGFVTGNDDVDMTAAGNWGQAKLSTIDITVANGTPANYTIVADEDRMIVCIEDGVTRAFGYYGKIDEVTSGTETNTLVVAYSLPSTISSSYASGLCGGNWKKLSQVDGTTELSCYGVTFAYSGVADLLASASNAGLKNSSTNKYALIPIGIYSYTAAHYGFFGTLRGVFVTHGGISGASTGNIGASKEYAFINDASGYSPVIFSWDSSTVF